MSQYYLLSFSSTCQTTFSQRYGIYLHIYPSSVHGLTCTYQLGISHLRTFITSIAVFESDQKLDGSSLKLMCLSPKVMLDQLHTESCLRCLPSLAPARHTTRVRIHSSSGKDIQHGFIIQLSSSPPDVIHFPCTIDNWWSCMLATMNVTSSSVYTA